MTLFTVDGLGHTWPGGVEVLPERVVGTSADKPNANSGASGEVGITGTIHGNILADIEVAAPQIGGVEQRGTGRIELGDEDIPNPPIIGIKRIFGGEVG